jgi:hypothetical protein
MVNPRRVEIFVRPKTRKNPRDKFANDPFNPASADSTTWRLNIEMRHAVVQNGIFCASGSSTGGAKRIPLRQLSIFSSTRTRAPFLERHIVSGKFRLLSCPARTGTFSASHGQSRLLRGERNATSIPD